MKTIGVSEQYEYFTSALSHCGTFLLNCNDKDVEYHIFEEFDGDCISFLSDTVLSALLSEQYISEEIYRLALNLAKSFRALENTALWNVNAVRNSKEWGDILTLADDINKKINNL